MNRTEQWRAVLLFTGALAPVAAIVGIIPGYFLGDGSAMSMLTGALIGLLIGTGMVGFQVSWGVGLIARRLREAPFLVVLAVKTFAWLAIIVVGLAIPLFAVARAPLSEVIAPSFAYSILISLAVAAGINFVTQINLLMGRGVLLHLVLGRYHRPREEDRVFLFVDLRDSTQIAERLGNLRYHALLRRFIADLTPPIMRSGGEVHRYIGDQVIVTWSQRAGLKNAACVRCYFAMVDALAREHDSYVSEFGVAPAFWAGLHQGQVVTGEIGTAKHEIVFLGDTMNTTARIEQACRDYNRPCIASADLINAVTLPADIAAENLGQIDLRGIAAPLQLYALSRPAREQLSS